MRRTKIVCTLGPATAEVRTLVGLIEAGMDVARLNLSHGTSTERRHWLSLLRQAEGITGRKVAVMLDTRGPEVRIGTFAGGHVVLQEGDFFTLTTEQLEGNGERVSVSVPQLPRYLKPGDRILLDDGNILLEVSDRNETEVRCRVIHGGVLEDRKKVNLPGIPIPLPAVCEADREDVLLGVRDGIDFVAQSFVRGAEDVLALRRILEGEGADVHIVAKVESREGVDRADEILRVADALMVARGDLGVEYPTEDIPLIQKRLIEKCNRAGRPVITATQMLESMIRKPVPTRAEASDVANAILDGTDAVMLSGETAVGRFPVEAVRVMARIAERAEEMLPFGDIQARGGPGATGTVTDAIGRATCTTAHVLSAAAIVTPTQSGYTARMVAKYRPRARIVAATPQEGVAMKLRLVWGVNSLVVGKSDTTDETINTALDAALAAGAIDEGDLVVITAGVPVGVPGTTNMLEVQTVGNILLRGTGIGHDPVTAPVCVATTLEQARTRFRRGDILVAVATDREYIPFLEQAAGIVAEEGGLTSHAAIVGLQLRLPVVVGASGATRLLRDGLVVTIDPGRGLVYRGEARVR